MPWAKATEPEKYAATLAVAAVPNTFRRYMIRLIEIRWKTDKGDWIKAVPLSVLEDSGIVMRFRVRPTEDAFITVAGRLAPSREWAFAELGMLVENPSGLATLRAAKEALDLELVSTGPAENLPPPLVLDKGRDLWVSRSHAI